jgi:hypothetical protein
VAPYSPPSLLSSSRATVRTAHVARTQPHTSHARNRTRRTRDSCAYAPCRHLVGRILELLRTGQVPEGRRRGLPGTGQPARGLLLQHLGPRVPRRLRLQRGTSPALACAVVRVRSCVCVCVCVCGGVCGKLTTLFFIYIINHRVCGSSTREASSSWAAPAALRPSSRLSSPSSTTRGCSRAVLLSVSSTRSWYRTHTQPAQHDTR